MKKILSALLICGMLLMLPACGENRDQDGTSVSSTAQSTAKSSSEDTTLSGETEAAQDYSTLTAAEKKLLLLSTVWGIVGDGNVNLGYHLYSEEDLKGKGFYYRFYDDNTMHEWADDTKWNKLYKWKFNDDGTIKVTNYGDETGASASKWYFDSKHLLNENLNTQGLTPMSATTKYPAEPKIIK